MSGMREIRVYFEGETNPQVLFPVGPLNGVMRVRIAHIQSEAIHT